MNRRITLVSLLVGLVILGMIAGLFTGSIEKALAVPISQMMGGSVNSAPKVVLVKPQATKAARMVTTPGTVQAAPTIGASTLAQDTFQRQNQQLWGTATDGRLWEGDANKAQAFSIVNGTGQIANAQGTLNALLGQPGTDMEVMASGSLNQFADDGAVNLGVVLRWSDTNDWYKVLIDGTHLSLLKRVKGVTTTLASVPFHAQGGTTYSLRFRTIGAMLFARAWQSSSQEPQNWMLNTNDTTLTNGLGGVRVLLQNSSIVNITAFSLLPATLGNTA